MSNNGSAVLVGVTLAGAALAALVWWDRDRAAKERAALAADDPTILPVGMFPALKLGDLVLVDAQLAKLPPPFSSLPRVLCEVDMVLMDPSVVSVKTPPGPRFVGAPFFSGTIPRAAIVQVVPPGLVT